MANTTSSFPIDFDFYNAEQEQVLFITDEVTGQDMTLEITNTSDEPITTVALNGAASATNCHFELMFRPDTLFNTPSALQLTDNQFELFVDKDAQGSIKPNPDGTLSLFVKVKSTWTLPVGGKLPIKLSHLRAATSDGTRGTRVMLKYKNLLHAGDTNSFSGFKETHLSIVNHRGKQNIPLHIGFVGANIVLNNGKSTNILNLRISNISRKNIAIDSASKSQFTLVLEGGQLTEEWTLATTDQIKNAIVKYKKPQDTALKYDATGTTEWVIPFVKLEKGQYIDIEISNLITNHPTGHANLYLHYENIPGYWDGEKTLIIEKSPLVFKNKNVGVGTSAPEMKLDVVGALGVRNEAAWDHFYIEHDGGTAFLNAGGAEHGMALRVGTGANGSYKGQDYTDVMRLMPNGNVGIGATNPASKLEVKGEIKMIAANKGIHGLELARIDEEEREHKWKFWHMDAAYGRNSLQIWEYRSDADGKHCTGVSGNVCWHRVTIKEGGNVGIGTNDPQALLDVNGEIRSKTYHFLADSKWNGQNIDRSGEHIIKFSKRNDPHNVFDDANSRFIAPTAGYYFFSTNLTFGKGNDKGDGVIVGIFKNGNVNDANTTIIVLEPGLFKCSTAQSVTSVMNLNQGDVVDVRLQGVDDSRFHISYNSFTGMLISK